jgi:hypothetical protein
MVNPRFVELGVVGTRTAIVKTAMKVSRSSKRSSDSQPVPVADEDGL